MEKTIEIIKTKVIDIEDIAEAWIMETPDLGDFVANYIEHNPDEVKNFDDIVRDIKNCIIDCLNQEYM